MAFLPGVSSLHDVRCELFRVARSLWYILWTTVDGVALYGDGRITLTALCVFETSTDLPRDLSLAERRDPSFVDRDRPLRLGESFGLDDARGRGGRGGPARQSPGSLKSLKPFAFEGRWRAIRLGFLMSSILGERLP